MNGLIAFLVLLQNIGVLLFIFGDRLLTPRTRTMRIIIIATIAGVMAGLFLIVVAGFIPAHAQTSMTTHNGNYSTTNGYDEDGNYFQYDEQQSGNRRYLNGFDVDGPVHCTATFNNTATYTSCD